MLVTELVLLARRLEQKTKHLMLSTVRNCITMNSGLMDQGDSFIMLGCFWLHVASVMGNLSFLRVHNLGMLVFDEFYNTAQ